MPITSIITQPATDALLAAYRPVILLVRASRTDGQAKPPVVYCDIYFSGKYYKTLQKTQYKVLNASNSDWQFDIQDACQEILIKVLGVNGGKDIIAAAGVMSQVYVKFRSSGYDANGFIQTEDTAPIQGTGTTLPTAGTGTQSHSFYVVNSTLQHESNQDYPSHLNAFKTRTWSANAWPLSHRQDLYKVGKRATDYFPIIYLGSKTLSLKLWYRDKGDTVFKNPPATGGSGGGTTGCNIVATVTSVAAATQAGGNYSYTANFSFSAQPAIYLFQFSTDGGSTWHQVFNAINNGVTVTYDIGILAETTHKLKVIPFCDQSTAGTAGIGNYTAGAGGGCAAVGIPSGVLMPDGIQGQPYNFSFTLIGDAPFDISSIVKPAWMTITNTGSTVYFGGTPTDQATDLSVSFTVSNCSGTHTTSFADVIDVKGVPSLVQTGNNQSTIGAFKIRTQLFDVGPSVSLGNRFQLIVYSHVVEVTAVLGDTPTSIAQKLSDAVNATTLAQWNEFGSDTTGTKPSSTYNANHVSVTLNTQNQFASAAYIS